MIGNNLTIDKSKILPKHVTAVETQSQLRGQIISSYAQVEFMLVHLIFQARIIKAYWSLGLRYRRKLDKKIEQVEKLIAASGPIQNYQDRVKAVMDQLGAFKDDRDYMAHAYCEIYFRDEEPEYRYRMIRNNENNEQTVEYRIYSPGELEKLERQLTSITNTLMELFREIYLNQGLEEYWTFT